MVLTVLLENQAAIRFYSRNGFSIDVISPVRQLSLEEKKEEKEEKEEEKKEKSDVGKYVILSRSLEGASDIDSFFVQVAVSRETGKEKRKEREEEEEEPARKKERRTN